MKTELENPNRAASALSLAGAAGGKDADPTQQVKREATFDELPPEQQIQRLRMELIVMRELTQSQQMLIERLMHHEHKGDGSMMVPMHRSGVSGLNMAGRRDPLR